MRSWIIACALSLLLAPIIAADQDDAANPGNTSSNGSTTSAPAGSYDRKPAVAENGDRRNADNDGDGRKEPVHVKGYERKDGTYVREHYRAEPKK